MNMLKMQGTGRLFFSALFIFMMEAVAGTNRINIGPREAFYIYKETSYNEFTSGITLGYQYSLLAADMFRISFGTDNSIDIYSGNAEGFDSYKTSGFCAIVEPGTELLFYFLMPFTARMQIGASYQLNSSTISYKAGNLRGGSNDSIHKISSSANRFGMYFSPGLFFQNNNGHIGLFTRHRFHSGVSNFDGGSSEFFSKMFDWGLQGGFITGMISHTIIIESSRAVAKTKGTTVWPDWSVTPPERRFSYTIGINIPRVLRIEKPGEQPALQQQKIDSTPDKIAVEDQEEQPVVQQDRSTNSTLTPETSINLQGDIFKPRCISECKSSSTVVDQCARLVEDAWYDAVAAKSHYMTSNTESNKEAFIKAIGVLKQLCSDACK